MLHLQVSMGLSKNFYFSHRQVAELLYFTDFTKFTRNFPSSWTWWPHKWISYDWPLGWDKRLYQFHRDCEVGLINNSWQVGCTSWSYQLVLKSTFNYRPNFSFLQQKSNNIYWAKRFSDYLIFYWLSTFFSQLVFSILNEIQIIIKIAFPAESGYHSSRPVWWDNASP